MVKTPSSYCRERGFESWPRDSIRHMAGSKKEKRKEAMQVCVLYNAFRVPKKMCILKGVMCGAFKAVALRLMVSRLFKAYVTRRK